MSTVIDLKADDVPGLETHIDQNLKVLIDTFQCCNAETYKNQAQFQFLPAHRSLIYNLPSKIQTMKEKRSKKSKPARKIRTYVIDEKDDDIEIVQQNEIVEQTQKELLKKLHEFGRLKNYEIVEQMSMANIKDTVFSFGDEITGQCHIVCPYCTNKYMTRYDKIWMTSNINKHFREHETQCGENMENEQPENDNPKESDQNVEIAVSEFGAGDETNDESLSKTIQLQIDSLDSPEKMPPRKYPRLLLHRVQVGEKNPREKNAACEKSVAREKGSARGSNIGGRTRRRQLKSGSKI